MNKYQRLEAKHSQDKYIIAGVVIALVVIGILMVWLSRIAPNNQPPAGVTATSTTATSTATTTTSTTPLPVDKITGLAKFLASKGITMYGAEWCTHCKDQKAAFGEAFKYITYVECPANTKLCLAKGVQGYPTWLKPSGEKLEGFIELAKLAAWAGYKY